MATGGRAVVVIVVVALSCLLTVLHTGSIGSQSGPAVSLRQRATQLPNGDFNLTVNPLSLVVYPGLSETSQIIVGSLDGFNGTVSLNPIPNYDLGIGLRSSVNPYSLAIPSGGKAFSTLTVSPSPSTPFGNYTVTMLVSGYGLAHNETVQVTIPGFRMDAFNRTSEIRQASSGFFTVTITSLLGFTGLVHFVVAVYSSGPEVSVSPSAVELGSGGTNETVVKVYIPFGLQSYREGVYVIELKATSADISEDFSLLVTTPGGIANLYPPILVAGGAILVALAAVFYKIFRARPPTSQHR